MPIAKQPTSPSALTGVTLASGTAETSVNEASVGGVFYERTLAQQSAHGAQAGLPLYAAGVAVNQQGR